VALSLVAVLVAACVDLTAPSVAPTGVLAPTPSAARPTPSPRPSASPHPSPTPSAATADVIAPCPGSDRTPGGGSGSTIVGLSSNWSGYVAAVRTAGVTCVEASWVEPTITCPKSGSQAVAIWIGIDGFASRTLGIPSTSALVQIGTQGNCRDGVSFHNAWHEVLPAEQHEIPLLTPIRAGDRITARVIYAGAGRFTMSLIDVRAGLRFNLAVTAPGAPRHSAEWIVEAPATNCPNSCVPIALPRFTATAFTNAHATIGGSRAGIADDRWTDVKLTMSRHGIVRTRPSSLSSGGTSFRVTWVHS
jgi:hypothetical protein